MLCDKCASIGLIGEEREAWEAGNRQHHSSLRNVLLAAKRGCDVCKAIWEEVKFTQDLNSDDPIHIFLSGGRLPSAGLSTIGFFRGEDRHFSVRFEFFVQDGCSGEIAEAFGGREVSLSPDSDACFKLCTSWLTECLIEHRETCPRPPAIFPTRVLDLQSDGTPSGPLRIRIMGFEDRGMWVSLSHCWGANSLFRTTTDNIQDRSDCINFADLPPSFRDAVIVTRRLKFRYLWIDSLCILQDNYEDWLREASRMHDYYKNSVLTIAADCAAGDDEGFLHRKRPPNKEPLACFPLHTALSDQSSRALQNDLDCVFIRKWRDKPQEPLDKRAWTLQESVLSPRIIHYTSLGLRWECQQRVSLESDLKPYIPSNPRLLAPPQLQLDPFAEKWPSSFQNWSAVVEDYGSRSLTFPSDKLPAISGVAREVYMQTKATYRAGMWLEDIYRGLSWSYCGAGRQPERYRAPSWSWAALDMIPELVPALGAHWYEQFEDGPTWPDTRGQLQAQILECHVSLHGDDPYGQVVAGNLTLKAYWTTWKRVVQQGKHDMWRHAPIVNRYDGKFWDAWQLSLAGIGDRIICSFDLFRELGKEQEQQEGKGEEKEGEEQEQEREQFKDLSLLQLVSRPERAPPGDSPRGRQYVLLLQPAGDEGRFSRVGLGEVPFEYRERDYEDDGWMVTKVSII